MSAAQATPGPGERYRVLRELGRRTRRTFAAIREPHELVVLQRFVRRDGSGSGVAEVAREGGEGTASLVALPEETGTQVTAEQIALLLRDARALEKHWHPNLARVKHVTLGGGDLRVATELIDGVTLDDLVGAATARSPEDRARLLSLPVLLRILVDVLGGLHGLHGLRDGMNASLDALHGELAPSNVVVGRDGVARLVAVLRPRPVRLASSTEALGYAAPEMLDTATVPDARADVYAVGVMLWEAMRGARLYPARDLAEIAQRQRTEDLEAPTLPESSPFAALADVATKALSFDRALRYRSASEMASEIRRIAGTRLAPGSVVAQTVAELAGDRIRARRAELDPVASGTRRRASSASMAAVDAPLGLGTDGDAGWSMTPPAGSASSDAVVTGPIDRVPSLVDAIDVEIDETTRMTAQMAAATDPPREAPKVEGAYLVVPARPMLESVDGDALAEAGSAAKDAPEPSTSRIKAATPPRPVGVGKIGVATAPVAFTPPGAKSPPRPAETPKPVAAKPPVPKVLTPRAGVLAAKPATPKEGVVATKPEGAAVAPVGSTTASPPQSEGRIAIESTEIEAATELPRPNDDGEDPNDAPTAVTAVAPPPVFVDPAPEAAAAKVPSPADASTSASAPVAARPVGAEDAAARAEIPRLWTESSHDLNAGTNVLEGDFVRALKAAASEPPHRAARAPESTQLEITNPTIPRAELTPELAAAAELTPAAEGPASTDDEPTRVGPGAQAPPVDASGTPTFAGTARVLSMSVLDAEEVAGSAPGASGAAPAPPPAPFAATPSFVPPAAPPAAANVDVFGVPPAKESGPKAFAETMPLLPDAPVAEAAPGATFGPDAGADAEPIPGVDDARRARARRIVFGIVGACGVLLVLALGVSALGGSSRETKSPKSPTTVATTTTAAAEAPKTEPEPAKAEAPKTEPGTSTAETAPPPATKPATPAAKPPPAAVARPTPPQAPPATKPAAAPAKPASRPKKPSYDPLGI